jgi:hypothetical protein
LVIRKLFRLNVSHALSVDLSIFSFIFFVNFFKVITDSIISVGSFLSRFNLLLFCQLTLDIDSPILFSTLTSAIFIKVKDERLLNSHVQVDVLVLAKLIIVQLLKRYEPLSKASLELINKTVTTYFKVTYELMVIQNNLLL